MSFNVAAVHCKASNLQFAGHKPRPKKKDAETPKAEGDKATFTDGATALKKALESPAGATGDWRALLKVAKRLAGK